MKTGRIKRGEGALFMTIGKHEPGEAEESHNMKPTADQNTRAGEYFVLAELHRRGAYAFPFPRNKPRVDFIAWNLDLTKAVSIQVKTRGSGTWQVSAKSGRPSRPNPNETVFWIFVDLTTKTPTYYVVPEWWIRNDIYHHHEAYLRKHGGKRKTGSTSQHHKIEVKRIAQWKNKWHLLGVWGP